MDSLSTKFNRIICRVMKHVYVVLLVLLVAAKSEAIPDYGLWCEGRAVLENGKEISGEISYDLKFEVVRIKENGMIQAFSAESLAYFELYDPIKQIHRKYVSVDSQVHPGYSRKAFFEIISHGELAYLRRSEYVRRPRATEDMRAPHIYLNTVCKHIYFVHDEQEGLVRVDNFKEEVLPRMNHFENEVQSYIDRCDLRLRKIHEQVRVINLYNQLYIMENKLAANNTAGQEAHKPNLR